MPPSEARPSRLAPSIAHGAFRAEETAPGRYRPRTMFEKRRQSLRIAVECKTHSRRGAEPFSARRGLPMASVRSSTWLRISPGAFRRTFSTSALQAQFVPLSGAKRTRGTALRPCPLRPMRSAMKFRDEMVIRRVPNALSRAFEHEVAVILPTASAVRVLNEVGGRIWALADGRTFAEILEVLVNEYDVERTQLRVDAESFLAQLQERGLLESPSSP